jgi:SAM-dependent methyltransferase
MIGPVDIDPRWYDEFFEGDWLDLLALRAPAERTAQEVDFVVEQLGLDSGASVLDVACGHGRHSLELARRGIRVKGIDLSPRSLAIARETAAAENLDVDFRELDMRELDYDGEFEGAVNLFTAFGYFEEEAENQRVLDGVSRALRADGVFLIDVINAVWIFGHYGDVWWEKLDDDVFYLQQHEYDMLAGRNLAVWTFIRPDGGRSEIRHSLRMYTPVELRLLLEAAGLRVDGAWGGFDGEELGRDSRRLILRARK